MEKIAIICDNEIELNKLSNIFKIYKNPYKKYPLVVFNLNYNNYLLNCFTCDRIDTFFMMLKNRKNVYEFLGTYNEYITLLRKEKIKKLKK